MVQENFFEKTILIVYHYSPKNYSLLLNTIQRYRNKAKKILVISFDTPLYERKNIIETTNSLRETKLDHIIFELNEINSPFFILLKKSKCYYCKSIRYSLLRRIFGEKIEIIDLEYPSEKHEDVFRAARENNIILLEGDTVCKYCSLRKV